MLFELFEASPFDNLWDSSLLATVGVLFFEPSKTSVVQRGRQIVDMLMIALGQIDNDDFFIGNGGSLDGVFSIG